MAAANKIQVGYIDPQDGVQFKVDEGTAAAPGVCFVDSAATGLYSPGTGQIAWSTSGKQTALRILADGKVGIDCSPTVALEVNGTIKASAIEAPIEGTLDDWIVHEGDTNTKIGFPDNDQFEIHAGGGPRLHIKSTGRIGINESSPNATLHIKNTDGTNNRLELVHANDAANEQNQITFKNNTTQYAYIVSGKDGSNNSVGLTFGTGATEKLRITATGQLRNQTTYDGTSSTSNDWPCININNLQGSYTAGRILGGVTFGKAPGHTNGIRAGMIAHYTATGNSAGNVGAYLSFRTSDNATGDSSEKLRITSDGVIETGTAVGGSGYDGNQRFRVGRAGDCNIAVRNTANTTSHTGIDFGDSGDDRAGRIQYMHNGDYMSFHTNGAGTGTANERLRITSTGTFGFNTTAPYAYDTTTTTFEVKGSVASAADTEVARFRGGSDANGGTAVLRLTNENDRGLVVKGGREADAEFAEFGTSSYNGTYTRGIRLDSGGNVIVGGTSFGAASSFSMAHGGQFRSVLAQNTAGTSLIGAISGVSNGFEINVDSSQNQNYKFHNGSHNNVTINQYGQVLIKTTSTANAHANADDLIIGDTGSDQRSGLTIVSDTDKDGAIHFSDGTGSNQLRGQIVYGHTWGSFNDVMVLYTAGTKSLHIQDDGDVILGEIGSTTYTESSTSAQLRVVGDASASRPGAISLMGFGNTTNAAHARINFQQQTSGTNGQTTARIEAINRSGAEDASDLVFYTEKTGATLKKNLELTHKGCALFHKNTTGEGTATNLSFDSLYLGIGETEGGVNVYRTIGLGWRANATSEYPSSIGCQITDWSGNTKADLVFATRNSTGQADVATERLRIKAVGESHFSGPVEINGGTFNASTDATLKIIASNNNDWGILVNKYTGSANEYGINVDIGKNAAYAYRIRGNGSQTYTVDGAGATTHNMWADAPTGFATGGLTKFTDAVAEYHYTWAQSGQEDYYIDLTCGSYFQAEFVYTSDQSNGGHLVEQYARGKWANNHTTHTGFLYEWSGGGGNLVTTFTASDQSGNGSVDLKGGLTTMGSAGASYRAQYGGGHEGSGGSANGRLRIAEDKNNVSASVGYRSLIIKVYYGAFSISKSVQ